ncbi:class I SAM-dependent methyltransferase [Bryobacter aggregatus]|uniref:class I SAM-dependent methyltransferase n=1 Tax=Bryobacter aggregatus TaxID=360054 RepID=UPI0004E15279|nr:class I SAM-dependent methyltransferase [Bryobacter aggregatus]
MKLPLHHRRVALSEDSGWSSNTLNEISQQFVRHCQQHQGTVLDIGAAHGIATLPALAAGAQVIANDSNPTHLESIRQQAAPGAPLTLLPGRFPYKIKLEEASLDAAHASNVLHFLTGRQLEIGAASLYHWLKPGGLFFAVAATPSLAAFPDFADEYKKRQQRGEEWPGWIENTRHFSNHRLLSRIPKSIHLLDNVILRRVFEAAGFEIVDCWLYRRLDLPKSLHSDGRESVGLIARKI